MKLIQSPTVRLVATAMVVAIFVVAGLLQREPEIREIRIGLAHPSGHSFSQALRKFAQSLEERSEGRFRVRIYPAAQLGGEREMQEMLALGTLDMSVTGLLNLYEPLFATFELPYLYRDREHVLAVMSRLPDQEIAEALIPHGVRLVGFLENGFRQVTNSRRPINVPEDLKGLIIRTPENPAQYETFKALGATPTPMSFAELYTALAQGVVDGQENPLQNIWSGHLAEVQEHIAMTRHIYNVAYVVASELTWERLSPEDRKLFRSCMDEATRWQLHYMAELDTELESKLKEAGMQFTYPDLAQFEHAAQPAYEALFQKLGSEARELVEDVCDTRATPPSMPRVFFLNSYHAGYGSSDEIMRGVREELMGRAELKIHYLDSKRQSSAEALQANATVALEAIREFDPDVLIASDDNAVKYVVASYFSEGPFPVVFCGVNWRCEQYGLPTANVTGMLEVVPVEEALQMVQEQCPQAKRLTILSENTTSERSNKDLLDPLYRGLGLDPTYALVDDFAAWKTAFVEANREADIVYMPTNGAIRDWDEDAAVEWVNQHIRVPVITCDDFMMPYCVLGVTKVAREQGDWAAVTALEILAGKSPQSIPVTSNHQTRIFFNESIAWKIQFEAPTHFDSFP